MGRKEKETERKEEEAELCESDLDWPCLIIHQRPRSVYACLPVAVCPTHNGTIVQLSLYMIQISPLHKSNTY